MNIHSDTEWLRAHLSFISAIRAELAEIKCLLAERAAREAKYNPHWAKQPRAPRGSPDGGQWVDGGGGGGTPKQTTTLRRPAPQPTRPTSPTAPGRVAAPSPISPNPPGSVPLGWLLRSTPLGFALPLAGDTPQPVVEARLVPGTDDLVFVHINNRQANREFAGFERIVTPEQQIPLIVFGVDSGLTTSRPAITEPLDVAVIIDGGAALYDPRALAREYGREIPGITRAMSAPPPATPFVEPVTTNHGERRLVDNMRAAGASSAEVHNAVNELRRNREIFAANDPRSRFAITRPTGRPGGGNLTGVPAQANANDDPETRASLVRQNDAVERLSRAGYRVHQNPRITPDEMIAAGLRETAMPDLIIEGRVFDVYSPITGSPESIYASIARKVQRRQAVRIIVNLNGVPVSRGEVERALRENPIPNLQEVITIDPQGRIGHAYP